jgi:hypothetical protein
MWGCSKSSRGVGDVVSFLPESHCSLFMSCCARNSSQANCHCSLDAPQAEIHTTSRSLARSSNAPTNFLELSATRCNASMTRCRSISKPSGRRMKLWQQRRLCSVRLPSSSPLCRLALLADLLLVLQLFISAPNSPSLGNLLLLSCRPKSFSSPSPTSTSSRPFRPCPPPSSPPSPPDWSRSLPSVDGNLLSPVTR